MRRPFLILALLATASAFGQVKTYIALGDSVGWGYQPNDTARGPGDKGYVRPVADAIGVIQGGVRPTLINLSIPGEDSTSFFDTSEIGFLLNSNYPLFGHKSQADTFKAKVAQELSRGHVITHVTFALGGNDLLDLLDSAFLARPFSEQKAIVDQTLVTTQARLTQEFTLIRQQLPNAVLVVPGYYNPYGAYPGSPEDTIGRYALPKLNGMLLHFAKLYRGAYADSYHPFIGNELAYTWIGDGDIHPRDPGYAVMAQQVITRLDRRLPAIGP
ncbi:MAG: hypothetical protein JSS66_15915 [Armatimonadetes bacterium]|nr:hypothetical protein [Armatimonadota bacterium]